MAGSKVSNFAIGDSNIQSVMLTLDKTFKGQHQVSLTNYDTTAESQVAAGSVIEIGGALYKFDSNESITGTPSDGTVYIMAVPSGDSVTCAYTNTAPTWSDSKQGWYGTGATVNNRYLEFEIIKSGSSWIKSLYVPNPKKTYITSNGTWEAPFSKYYQIEMQATGGRGGGVQVVPGDSTIGIASGGGGGCYGRRRIFIPAGQTWTATFSTTSGANLTFSNGSITLSVQNGISATNASPGATNNEFGAGGSASSGMDITIPGSDGGPTVQSGSSSIFSGEGGGSYLSGKVNGKIKSSVRVDGNIGKNYGGGSSGSSGPGTTGAAIPAAGSGIIIIT
jgi:hypothetical protein